jgi:PGM1 C-terminal domain
VSEAGPSLAAPEPGSTAELAVFRDLQSRLPDLFRKIFPDPLAPRTVVIIPSLSLDQDVMARVTGVHHYEERMLCMLMLLKLPRTRVVYVTSQPVSEDIIDYYLHLLAGVPATHARQRLTLFSCFDSTPTSLAAKILARPRLLARLRDAIPEVATAHMSCFNVSALERTLAVQLGIPIYGCDPALLALGSKSGSRAIFREAGVPFPAGFENLADQAEVAAALSELKTRHPGLQRAVVKLNEGFSGEGNAIFGYEGAPVGSGLEGWIKSRLPALAFEARDMSWEAYSAKIHEMGAIVEEFVDGAVKRSPSVQYRIDPLGQIEVISTHDQVLGGRSNQVFLGCRFPADVCYRLDIQEEGLKAARILRDRGVLGRFGIDFLSVWDGHSWRHRAIEINLRKGGTTHPFMMLQFLTDGRYNPASGEFRTRSGVPRCYYASDNLEAPVYRGLTPADLLDIAVVNGLHFNGATQQGVVFHLIGALSEFGKLGIVCVAPTSDEADQLYRETVAVLDREQAGKE